jgi:hypothetical protein
MIDAAWKSYEAEVLPPGCSTIQRTETRRAFYAGAQALFRGLLSRFTDDHEPTEQDLAQMSQVDEELKAFAHDLRRGRA